MILVEKKNKKMEDEVLVQIKEEDKKENRRRYIVYLLVFLLLLFFATFGITYTLYNGTGGEGQEIITDQIIFSYSDADRAGRGINMIDVLPTADDIGKHLIGTNQYFDFSVTATSKNSRIRYRLLINKSKESTLSDDNVRIYLTEVNGNLEKELVLNNVSELKEETINGIKYYVLYEKTLDKGIVNYSDFYRLRMWVKFGASNYESKKFGLKVDVRAVQVEE